MNINKRTYNALKKGMLMRNFTYAAIGKGCEVTGEAVRQMIERQSIPDKHVLTVEEITGIEIK